VNIYEFVKKQRDDYRSQRVNITDGYDFSQYETLRTIELYHNSRFTTGPKDTLKREKPFYNITKFRVNVATRATDIDTKDVKIESDRPGGQIQSFILNLKNRNWMKESHYNAFLNTFGHTRAKYGGVLVKKTETDGELRLSVMPWLDMVTDQIDIGSGVKIERHYYTPAELKTNVPKTWANIDDAIDTAKKSREAQAANRDEKENLTPGSYVEVWEVHGVLPTCYLAGTSDKYPKEYGSEDEYERQMHVLVLDESNKEENKGVTLYGGVEDEDPYKYLPYEKVDGRGLGIGVVEDLFEAQVWTNYSVKQKKDMLDLAGRIIFQTADSNVAAKNILTDIENGAILTTSPNMPITQVNNVPASIPAFSEMLAEWNTQGENVTSTYPAILGSSMPHGTAFRSIAALTNEATALFEYRKEEAGIFIQELYFDWILPFQIRQLKKDKDLTATLEPEELETISEAWAQHLTIRFAKDQILDPQAPALSPDDVENAKNVFRSSHMAMPRKSFTNFNDLFEDWQGTVDVNTTDEQKDKAGMLQAIDGIFKTVATAPQILQDPRMADLFNQMIALYGFSPLAPGGNKQQPAIMPTPVQPQQVAPTPA
jgi:hypothetical protein